MVKIENNCRNSARALVIMGMHRSGTSALAGLLNQLGVEMGSCLMPAQEGVNEKGFWEQEEIVSVHDRLLQYYGLSWDDPRHLPRDWWLEEFPQHCLEEICRIIADDMKDSALWAIKDPRMCRLMPLWHQVFSRLNIEPLFLCIVRNPLEVAASLYARDRIPKDLVLLLWVQHNLEALDGTLGYERRFIGYKQLLTQGEVLLRGILQEYSIDLKTSRPVSHKEDQFLSAKLRHHNISDDELESDTSIPCIVRILFSKLVAAAEAGTDLSNNDWQAIKCQYAESAQLLKPWLNLSKKLQKDLARKNIELEHLHRENELITQGLRQAEKTVNNNRSELDIVDAALKEAQQLVREKEARELELDTALKQAQQLVREKEVREQELDTALKMANGYVRDREKDVSDREKALSGLTSQVEGLKSSIDRIEKHWWLGYIARNLIRSAE